jgi:peptidoglycan/xylan/chitin deacetylase (PgdA/CDA1 family)
MRPLLCFSVDVEEDMPLWRVQIPTSTSNAECLPRLAEMCRQEGVRPTWLCTYPMLTEARPRAILAQLARDGAGEIGTHLHPWNTPPFLGVPSIAGDERAHAYYLRELGPERFRAKLERLHAAATACAGQAPTTFRAGRFGIDAATLCVLPEFGYRVDTSVTPLVHHDEDGGPDFRAAPQRPYRPSAHDVCKRGALPLVELPLSIALTRHLPRTLSQLYVRLPRSTRLRGLLSRDYLKLLDFAWLYPARFDLALMQGVARSLVAADNPLLHVFLHSSELAPGSSPYVQTAAEVERCFERLRDFFRFARTEFGAEPVTLAEAGARLEPGLGATPAVSQPSPQQSPQQSPQRAPPRSRAPERLEPPIAASPAAPGPPPSAFEPS